LYHFNSAQFEQLPNQLIGIKATEGGPLSARLLEKGREMKQVGSDVKGEKYSSTSGRTTTTSLL
jgi:hypothetical protein